MKTTNLFSGIVAFSFIPYYYLLYFQEVNNLKLD